MKRARRGFTLAELLVTVTLLAVLAGVVLPRLIAPAPDGALVLRRILSEGSLQAQRAGAILFLRAQEKELVLFAPSTEREEQEVGRYPLEGPWEGVLVPERLLLFPDGSFSPTQVILRSATGERAFHVTVAGQIIEMEKR